MNPAAQKRVLEDSSEVARAGSALGKIGRFELVEEIGTGSMGVVYLARDPMIGRWVAVKRLTGIKGKDIDPETVRRLLINEARNVGALEHPGILTVFDVVEDREGRVEALAMEFVGGQSLRQRLDAPEPISLKYIGEIVSAVAEALDYAHASGCIHRDIKPANILLGHDGAIKIADFGIAALRGEDLATELRALGTPNYLAPERVMGHPGDHLGDVYSLGVILYELLTRRLPYEASSIADLVRKIVQEEPVSAERYAPELMPGLVEILNRALAKEPEERYRSAGELAAAVRGTVEAHAALNDTVPSPLSLLPLETPEATHAAEPASPVNAGVGQTASQEVLSPLTVLSQPAPEAGAGPVAVEVEEVEWESASAVDSPAAATGATRLKTGLATGKRWASRSASWAWRAAGSGYAALRRRPALAGSVVGALLLAALVIAFRGGDDLKVAALVESDPVSSARRQVVQLLAQGRALLEAGESDLAAGKLRQADLLFPVQAHEGRNWMILAAEREIDRLDGIDEMSKEALTAISRGDFRTAGRAIERLVALEAPPETMAEVEGALVRARRRARTASQAPEPEPAAPVEAAARPRPQRPVPVVQRQAPTGPGTLRIEFKSERPRGVLTIFADGRQILNRRYRFVEKKNFVVRKGVSGSFVESVELPAGARQLKIYLTQPRLDTQHRPLRLEVRPSQTSTLRLGVAADGRLSVGSS